MSAIMDKFGAFVAKLEDEGHHLAAEARGLFNHFEQEVAAVEAGVKPLFTDFRTGVTADVKAVFTEAKTAGADIVARAEAAVAKFEELVQQQQPPAAS